MLNVLKQFNVKINVNMKIPN